MLALSLRYPDSLDAAVDSVMSSAESEMDRKVIKQFLNLSVSSVHHRLAPNSQATLALCLHHRHSSVRLHAITYLMDNLDTVSGLLDRVVFTGGCSMSASLPHKHGIGLLDRVVITGGCSMSALVSHKHGICLAVWCFLGDALCLITVP